MTSSRTRSGRSFLTSSSASMPSVAVITRQSTSARQPSMSSRLRGWSSTTRTTCWRWTLSVTDQESGGKGHCGLKYGQCLRSGLLTQRFPQPVLVGGEDGLSDDDAGEAAAASDLDGFADGGGGQQAGGAGGP